MGKEKPGIALEKRGIGEHKGSAEFALMANNKGALRYVGEYAYLPSRSEFDQNINTTL